MWMRRLRKGRRWLRHLLPALIILLLMAGCGQEEAKRLKSYGNDGYMGQSNSNPLLPRTGSAWSYEDDREFASQLLRPMQGIRDSRITVSGDDMRVTLYLQPALSREEAARLTSRAEKVMAENFPRYDVSVKAEQ